MEQWASRLRVLASALSRSNHEETWHRAGQIAELKAGRANKIHHDDRPNGLILSQPPGCDHHKTKEDPKPHPSGSADAEAHQNECFRCHQILPATD